LIFAKKNFSRLSDELLTVLFNIDVLEQLHCWLLLQMIIKSIPLKHWC